MVDLVCDGNQFDTQNDFNEIERNNSKKDFCFSLIYRDETIFQKKRIFFQCLVCLMCKVD